MGPRTSHEVLVQHKPDHLGLATYHLVQLHTGQDSRLLHKLATVVTVYLRILHPSVLGIWLDLW